MKTTSLFILVSLLLLTVLITCSDDSKNRLSENDLPTSTRIFIETYLPDYTILEIEDLQPGENELEKYKVKFTDGLTIIFNILGNWWYTECETGIPQSLMEALPQPERYAFETFYPDTKLKVIQNGTIFPRKVQLMNGNWLVFYYDDFNKIGIGEDLTEKPDKVPSKITELINTHYRNFATDYILFAKEEGDEEEFYKVSLSFSQKTEGPSSASSPVTIKFDKEGNWFMILSNSFLIPAELYDSLPEDVKEMKQAGYPNEGVYGIRITGNMYQLYIGKDFTIIITSGENPEVFRVDVIQAFLREHYPNHTTSMRFIIKSKNPTIYTCFIKIDNIYNLEMDADLDGVWQRIIVKDGATLPATILKTLPEKILYDLNNKGIRYTTGITKSDDGGYAIHIHEWDLLYDKDGNFIETTGEI